MPAPPNVALLIETSNAYARGLLRGIRRYVREHGPWSLYLGEQRRGEAAPTWLARWRGDGIIARIETAAIARAVLAAKQPAVDVSAARHVPRLPYVETDDDEIARLVTAHLVERGFRHLAFCGDPRFQWSNLRAEHFERRVEQAGLTCDVYQPGARARRSGSWEVEKADLGRWLARLPKPVGIMACYDIRGRQVLDVCREQSIAVPDQVAVIGVDNDELMCDLASPSLSSVAPDAAATGYEAARLLAEMMAGRKVAPGGQFIRPIGIVTRGSTDVLATDDAELSQAVRFIREHAWEGIKVDDVLRAVPLSRRVLEARFRKLLGRSPHEEIERIRLERARQLLGETELPQTSIAERCGYRHAEYFSVVFKRATGETPSEFRARQQG